MCGESHENFGCACSRFCGIVRLVMAGIIIGTVAGMVGMYFFDHDRWLQYKAKKMIKGAQDLTNNIKCKITGEDNGN